MVLLRSFSFYGYFHNFSCFWGFSIYNNSVITVHYQHITVIITVALLQFNWLHYSLSQSTHITLVVTNYWYAFPQPQRKSCLPKTWNTNWKKQYRMAHKELFSWKILLYSLSQFLKNVPGWIELSHRQETQCIETQSDARLLWMWWKFPQFLFRTQNSAQGLEKKGGAGADSSIPKDRQP